MAEALTKESLMEGLFGKGDTKPESFNSMFDIEEEIISSGKDNIKDIPAAKLTAFPNHHFHRPDGEEWESFVESIKTYGVLQPIIVRKHPEKEDFYQIIAGHCRTAGAKEAGKETLPAIVIDVEDDVDASVLVGLTNKQRKPSDLEWGWTYRETYELIKRRAGRPKDNVSHGETNLPDISTDSNVSHGETNLTNITGTGKNVSHGETNLKGKRTDEILAEKYGESRASIQRKMRLTYLIQPLAALFKEGKLKQKIAVGLSYLTEDEQKYVSDISFNKKITITEKHASALKAASKEAADKNVILTADDICNILLQGADKNDKNAPQKAPKYSLPDTCFPKGVKKQEREQYVIKALEYIRENEIHFIY